MSAWLIIPVKPLRHAKSRLSPVLKPQQRCELARATLRHVLRVASGAASIDRVLVVTRCADARSLAGEFGAETVREPEHCDLNGALRLALQRAQLHGAETALILPADLPFVAPDDIQAIVGLSRERSIAIAADRAGDGTNALVLRPPDSIDPAYGPGSFSRHIQLAQEAGVAVHRYQSQRLALDIDTPLDLYAYMRALEGGEHAHLPRFELPRRQTP